MLAIALSFLTIIGRAFFYFQDQINAVLIVDVLSLLSFVVLIVVSRKNVYAGIVAFLPSVSLYLFLQNKSISDLLFVSFLLSVTLLFHGRRSEDERQPVARSFLLLYLVLLSIFLLSNYLNLYLDRHLPAAFPKFLDYLVLTIYAGVTFLAVFRPGDRDRASKAFLAGAVAYTIASTLGYFYFQRLELPEYADDVTKELFRYPGFSNSNFTGNVIVLMIAIAYSLRRERLVLSAVLVVLTAVLSQSRSVFVGGMLFLGCCVVTTREKSIFRTAAGAALLTAALAGAVYLTIPEDGKVQAIVEQYIERVSLRSATENVSERMELAESAVRDATEGWKNPLFGVGSVEDGVNPHNSLLQALLLFGVFPTLIVVSYFLYAVWKVPVVIFAVVASLAEILFFTSTYDFLFFVLLVVSGTEVSTDTAVLQMLRPMLKPDNADWGAP